MRQVASQRILDTRMNDTDYILIEEEWIFATLVRRSEFARRLSSISNSNGMCRNDTYEIALLCIDALRLAAHFPPQRIQCPGFF